MISSELYHLTVSEVTAFRKSRRVTVKPGEDAVASKSQLRLCLDMSSLLRRFCSVMTICPVLVKTQSGLRLHTNTNTKLLWKNRELYQEVLNERGSEDSFVRREGISEALGHFCKVEMPCRAFVGLV